MKILLTCEKLGLKNQILYSEQSSVIHICMPPYGSEYVLLLLKRKDKGIREGFARVSDLELNRYIKFSCFSQEIDHFKGQRLRTLKLIPKVNSSADQFNPNR